MAIYDDDVFVEGKFYSNSKDADAQNPLDPFFEGDHLTLVYIPVKELSYSDSNGFGIYVCEDNSDRDAPPTFILCGNCTDHLDLGHTYSSDGVVAVRNKSKQFHISNITKVTPETRHGIISFMRSLDGMKCQADIIYDHFKQDSLSMIRNHPEKILDIIKTSYPEQVNGWKHQIDNCKNNFGHLADLISLGLKPQQAKRIYSEYGETAMEKIKNDPYFLIGKVRGYGFKKCDAIGREIGIKPNDQDRLCTGVLYTIQNLMANGSTCIDRSTVIDCSVKELSISLTYNEMLEALNSKKNHYTYKYGSEKFTVPVDQIKDDYIAYCASSKYTKSSCRTVVCPISEEDILLALSNLQLSERIVIEDDMVFMKRTYDQELNIAYYLQQISRKRRRIKKEQIIERVDWYCKQKNIDLEEKQREAVIEVCSSIGGINIINGAAGCGKTFCIKVALNVLKSIYKDIPTTFSHVIIAPTGKAARVAHNATGIDAYTIHKLLQYKQDEGFYYNAQNRLPYDCVVIDECSMLDTNLAYSLFSAIEPSTKVIMMGDTNQLPSIGAGNVFHDLINSGVINVVTLNVIKRQGKDSGIVKNARLVMNGEVITSQRETGDSLVVGAANDSEYISKIKAWFAKLVERNGIEDAQVLSPMKSGIAGTNYLNYILQQEYNKNPDDVRFLKNKYEVMINDERQCYSLYFRIGDKVINTKNDYNTPWYHLQEGSLAMDKTRAGITNGEVGEIYKLIEGKDSFGDPVKKIVVKYDEKYIVYENDFDNLELAYAITIHRSQGSEWEAIIVVLNKSHKTMIDRNLFYTGITRSKNMEIVISDQDTIRYGVHNTKSTQRKTGLISRLHTMVGAPRDVSADQDYS